MPHNLATYIATYVNLPSPDAQLRVMSVLMCPGFEVYNSRNIVNIATNISYVTTIPNQNGLTNAAAGNSNWYPFGYNSGSSQQGPHRISEIQAQQPLTDVWMLADTDKVAVNDPLNNWYSQLPDKPVHGSVRNFIYYDNHVATRKVGKAGTY